MNSSNLLRPIYFSSQFEYSDHRIYCLSFPFLLSDFEIEDKIEENPFRNLKSRPAKCKETREEMQIITLDSKTQKKWIKKFVIWKTLYHYYHVGIHIQIKEQNNVYFLEDRRYIPLIKIIEHISGKQQSFPNIFENKDDLNSFVYNENFVKDIAVSLFSFLSYLHSRSVVFGDLNLVHLVITQNKEICLTTSSEMSRNKTRCLLTYCAPEALENGKYYSSSDVWSAGIILYILLFGSYPFSIDSEETLKNGIKTKNASFPVPALNLVSNEAMNFVLKLLKKRAGERLTASQCLEDEWFKRNKEETVNKDSKEYYQEIVSSVLNTFQKINLLKFNKHVKCKYSIVENVKSEPEKEKFNLYSSINQLVNLRQTIETKHSQIQQPEIRILITGLAHSGKRSFVDKLISIVFKTQSVSIKRVYSNGSIKSTYSAELENRKFKFIVLDIPIKGINKSTKSEKSKNIETPRSKLSRTLGEEEHKIFPEKKREALTPRNRGLSTFITIEKKISDNSLNNSKNKKICKVFDWDQLQWDSEFSDLDGILFFSSCEKYEDDLNVDKDTIESYKTLFSTSYFNVKDSIHGCLPVMTVVNKIDLKPFLNKSYVTSQFQKFCPYQFQGFNNILFNSINSEDKIKSFISKFESINSFFSTDLQSHTNLNYSSLILRNFTELKSKDFLKLVSFNLTRLELKKIKDSSKIKNFEKIIAKLEEDSLKHFSLSDGTLSPKHLDSIANSLKKSSSLESLKLINLQINTKAMSEIISSLFGRANLNTLDISENVMDSFCMKKLSELVLSSASTPRFHFYISKCSLTEEDLEIPLLHILRYSNKLFSLDISKNLISDTTSLLEKIIIACRSNFSLPLSNFQYSVDSVSSELIDSINVLLAEKRKNVFRGEIFKVIEKKKKLLMLNLRNYLPLSPLTGIFLNEKYSNTKYSNVFEIVFKRSWRILKEHLDIVDAKEQINETEKMSANLDPIYQYFSVQSDLEKSHFEILDLTWLNLSSQTLPEQFLNLKVLITFYNPKLLKKIDLSNNELVEIPNQIFEFKHLEEIRFRNNFIVDIPEKITCLTKLTVLDLGYNEIFQIPSFLCHLLNLKELYLDNNLIYFIASKVIQKIERLQVLSLHNNFLYKLPFDFYSLKNLREFTIFNNHIDPIKKEIMEIWGRKGNKANFSGMNLEDLPHKIFLLPGITSLILCNNKIKFLPPEIAYLTSLKNLDLRNNLLTELPFQLSKILTNLNALYLSGNKNLKIPKEILQNDSPLKIEHYPILINHLESLKTKKYQKRNFNICVLTNSLKDYNYFVQEFFIHQSGWKTNVESEENKSKNILKRFSNNNIDHLAEGLSKIETLQTSSEKLPTLLKKKVSVELQRRLTSEKFETSLPKIEEEKEGEEEEKDDLDDQFYKELEFEELGIRFKVCGFENIDILNCFCSLFNEETEFIFVVIAPLEDRICSVLSSIQTIRSENKSPVIVLGNNFNLVEKKKRKEIEKEISLKLSNFYYNIHLVSFMIPQNSKLFFSCISKYVGEIKISYQQYQIENTVNSESNLEPLFPVINYSTFQKIAKDCSNENEKDDLNIVIEKSHRGGNILYFNNNEWGANKVVVIRPSFLVFLIRKILQYSKKTNGIFDFNECFSNMISGKYYWLFSKIWFPIFGSFISNLNLMVKMKENSPIHKQYSSILENLLEIPNQKIYIFISQLPEAPYTWSTVMDFSSTFLEFVDQYIDKKYTTHSSEKWFQLTVLSPVLLKKIFYQVVEIPKLTLLRMWRNVILCKIENTFLALGMFKEEENYYIKLYTHGEAHNEWFFIINDITESAINGFTKISKISMFETFVPLKNCKNSTLINTIFLKKNLSENNHKIECPYCPSEEFSHQINIPEIAPFLIFQKHEDINLTSKKMENKLEIAKGSAGTIYRASYKGSKVAIKEFIFDEYLSDDPNQEISKILQSWK